MKHEALALALALASCDLTSEVISPLNPLLQIDVPASGVGPDPQIVPSEQPTIALPDAGDVDAGIPEDCVGGGDARIRCGMRDDSEDTSGPQPYEDEI